MSDSDLSEDTDNNGISEGVEPMLDEMEQRRQKRLEQLAVARKKSLDVRKERDQPKKKRKELQAQVNKVLYDQELAKVAELQRILAESEMRNKEQEAKLRRKEVNRKKVDRKCDPKSAAAVLQPPAADPDVARLEVMMRQLYSG